tara:strand:- start:234 stop:575 length:342 start_codon:yes stop_codon:yes gene_type:complete
MKDNKLIAEFMEFHRDTEDLYLIDNYNLRSENQFQATYVREMKFHQSWDWLMPVVEKIESDERYDVDILQYGTRIRDNQKEIVTNVADISFNSKIDHTYDAVVRFLKRLTDET